jgi:hypothetical protein
MPDLYVVEISSLGRSELLELLEQVRAFEGDWFSA